MRRAAATSGVVSSATRRHRGWLIYGGLAPRPTFLPPSVARSSVETLATATSASAALLVSLEDFSVVCASGQSAPSRVPAAAMARGAANSQ